MLTRLASAMLGRILGPFVLVLDEPEGVRVLHDVPAGDQTAGPTAPAPVEGGLLRERVHRDHAPVRDWQFGGQMCPRCLQAWPCLPVGRYAGEEWREWAGL